MAKVAKKLIVAVSSGDHVIPAIAVDLIISAGARDDVGPVIAAYDFAAVIVIIQGGASVNEGRGLRGGAVRVTQYLLQKIGHRIAGGIVIRSILGLTVRSVI